MKWYKNGLYPEWHIGGEKFSPKELKSEYPDILLRAEKEKTDIGKRGRYKDREYGYGSCVLVVKEEVTYKLDWLLNFILNNQKQIRELGVDDESIWIFWWGIQGNMELSPAELNKICKTGNHLNMNYYYIDDEPTAFNE